VRRAAPDQSSPSALIRIDQACNRFEQAWRSGENPIMEDYLTGWSGGEQSELFGWLLLLELDYRRQRGQLPTVEEYRNRFSAFTREIDDVFAELRGEEDQSQPRQETTGDGVERPTRLLDQAVAVEAELSDQFGRYRILRRLGSTGMETSFLAHDTQLNREVVLKVPRLGTSEEVARKRFVQAARAAGSVYHANLCPILDAGEIDGVPYLTTPNQEGQFLVERLRIGPLPSEDALLLAEKLARALHVAHEKGLLHRDLMSASVLLTRAGEPMVINFALARREGEARITTDGQVLGTPGYLAPERLSGSAESDAPAADIYSLGVLLYEMLTGELPFGRSMRELMLRAPGQEASPPSHKRADVSATLDAVCLKALAADPGSRYASMAEFAEALGTARVVVQQSNRDALAASVAAPQQAASARQNERGRWLVHRHLAVVAIVAGLLGLGLLVAGGISGWFGSGDPERRQGLLAELYSGQFDEFIQARVDENIDISELRDSQSIRWTGYLKAPKLGIYNLSFQVDDAVSLWLDGKLLIDHWAWHGASDTSSIPFILDSKPLPIKVEYYNVIGSALSRLMWKEPGQSVAKPVPPGCFLYDHDQEAAWKLSQRKPDKPIDAPSTERVLATWALSLRGKVRIKIDGQPAKDIRTPEELPLANFQLDCLDLRDSTASAEELRKLFRVCSLGQLSLAGMRVGDEGASYSRAMSIKDLNLSETGITDGFFAARGDDPIHWQALQTLDISGNPQITDNAIRALAGGDLSVLAGERIPKGFIPMRRISAPNLARLYLQKTNVTDACLKELQGKEFRNLQEVQLNGTKITKASVMALPEEFRRKVKY
jgi:serine/threonine protein kinase